MRAAPSRASLLALLVTASCGADFAPRSVLQDLRVLAILAAPLEVGPGESVTLRAVTVPPPGGSLAKQRWTFCPFSIGASAGYACAAPQCEIELAPAADGSVTASPTVLAQQCLAALQAGGGLPTGIPAQLPAKVELIFKYVVSGSDGSSREAVQRVPFYTAGPPAVRNQPPVIQRVEIGGQPVAENGVGPALAPGAQVEVLARLAPASAESYVEEDGRPLVETLVVSFYTTAGRFDFDRASGPDAGVVLKHEKIDAGTLEARLWVVARDLRGGQAVAGPFRVPLGP